MKKLFCLLMALLCLASAALSEEETEQKAERLIDPTKPMIALTFDDGPSEYTQRILDTLEKYGCHATFCMVGNRMGQNAEAVAAVVLIPLAVIAYSVQAALCVGAEITLWINFKKQGACRIAGMVIAIICLILIAASISYFSYLLIISN